MVCSSQAPLSIGFLSDKNTIVGYHFLLQGIFSTQQSNLHILHWQVGSLTLGHLGNPLIKYNQHPYKKGRFGHRAWHTGKSYEDTQGTCDVKAKVEID